MRPAKAGTGINKLSIIWKSNQSDKIKRDFFPSSGRVNSTVWVHHMVADKAYRKKKEARREQQKNVTSCIEQILEATSHETTIVRPPTSYL